MPVANTYARNKQIWTGALDISRLDPSAPSLQDLQIWGFSRSKFPSSKESGSVLSSGGDRGTSNVSKECETKFGGDDMRLSAVTCIDVASIQLWMVSGPAMEVYTTNAVTEAFFKSVLASSNLRDSPNLSCGLIVKLSPPTEDITSLVIFGHVSSSPTTTMTTTDIAASTIPKRPQSYSPTNAQVTIKALPLNASCRLRSYVRHKRKCMSPISRAVASGYKSSDESDNEAYENKDAVFLDASVEEVASAQKRNEKLEQLLQRRTSFKRRRLQSVWYSRPGSVPQDDSQPRLESQDIVAENSLLEQQHSFSQQASLPESTTQSLELSQQSHHLAKGPSSNTTSKTALTLQRVLMSALRLRGISRPHSQAASGHGDLGDAGADVEYKELYHHAYRATLFALRNKKSHRNRSRMCSTNETQLEKDAEPDWHVRRIEHVVERILDIFLEADVEETCP
ncbi:uncharacterized protein V1513DRAFT_448428 [Lipomyces chichibuensis]|uniref:uncharacterized protein n=1 Tax=Lipomyces chichibuensis TaxID=1546026 RepID=UPI0033440EF6